jgi:hypothetical protein
MRAAERRFGGSRSPAGGLTMRLLLAIDQFAPSRAATDFAAGLAAESEAAVWVFHVRELPNTMRVSPLETAAESEDLVHARAGGRQLVGDVAPFA